MSKVLLPNTLGKVAEISRAQNLEKNLDPCMITAIETHPNIVQFSMPADIDER